MKLDGVNAARHEKDAHSRKKNLVTSFMCEKNRVRGGVGLNLKAQKNGAMTWQISVIGDSQGKFTNNSVMSKTFFCERFQTQKRTCCRAFICITELLSRQCISAPSCGSKLTGSFSSNGHALKFQLAMGSLFEQCARWQYAEMKLLARPLCSIGLKFVVFETWTSTAVIACIARYRLQTLGTLCQRSFESSTGQSGDCCAARPLIGSHFVSKCS